MATRVGIHGPGRVVSGVRIGSQRVDVPAAGESPGYHPSTELLTIEFVRVEGDRVVGRLSAYTDPQCGCTLLTTFEGRIRGDAIDGTFTSRHQDGRVDNGQWGVRRQVPTPKSR